jgi:hypothetical protein
MRIDIKKVHGSEYLQYVDIYGHIFHIGPADDLENWKVAAWLYGSGLFELKFQFYWKVNAEVRKRFPGDHTDLIDFTSAGMDGSVGFNKSFDARLSKVYDKKWIELDKLRQAVREKFPDIKTKKRLKDTVRYNWKLQHPKPSPVLKV